ncbi:ATPase AAA-type core [Penicillium expansum]|nr:ATPase AAA-type core [Penicillium expansum]
MEPNAVPSAAPSAGDLILQQRTQALQSAQKGDGSLFSQLTSNPLFTAGFGLAGLGAGLTLAQKGVRHGAALLRRRMLVDVEISIKDDSYPWFLHWMTLYQQSQLNAGKAAASTSTYMDRFLQKLTPGMRHLSIQTQKVEHSKWSNSHTLFADSRAWKTRFEV